MGKILETSLDKTDWHFVGSYEPLLFCHDLVSHWKAGKLEWGDANMGWSGQLSFAAVNLKPPKPCWYMGYDQNFSSHSHISTLGKFDENWGSKIHPMEILWVFPRNQSISASRCSPASWWHDPLPESPDVSIWFQQGWKKRECVHGSPKKACILKAVNLGRWNPHVAIILGWTHTKS